MLPSSDLMNIFGGINRDEDMRKLLLLIALPVFLGLASCEKEVLKILPQKIELVGAQDLVFGYGTTEKVEFMVSPPDAQFNYDRLFQDERFKALVKERWTLLKPGFETLPEYIRIEAGKIRNSESMNHRMWPITQVVNKDESMSFDQAVESMTEAYRSKLEWMDNQITRL